MLFEADGWDGYVAAVQLGETVGAAVDATGGEARARPELPLIRQYLVQARAEAAFPWPTTCSVLLSIRTAFSGITSTASCPIESWKSILFKNLMVINFNPFYVLLQLYSLFNRLFDQRDSDRLCDQMRSYNGNKPGYTEGY